METDFPAELERLLKAYRAEANAIERFRIGQQIDALLRNPADAILGLVRAADEIVRISDRKHDAWDAYKAARAKLNRE